MRLYKYTEIERIDILLNEAIRYTQPSALNDPYEMRVDFDRLTSDDYSHFKDLSKTYTDPERSSKFYEELPDSWRSALPITKEQFVAMCLNVAKDSDALANQGISLVSRLASFMTSVWSDAVDRTLGILSLSEVPDNLLMWSHYAKQHNGIVIELDSLHPTLNGKRRETDDLYHCRSVAYSRTRPTILNQYNVTTLLTKAEDCSYEKEWRIMKPLSETKRIIHATPFNIHLLEMPADCIKRVIFGGRIPFAKVADEAQKIRSQSRLLHVMLTRATLKLGEFGLNLDEPV